ncbi:MAG: transglutaminase domain-containing protein, partial [Clostridia bacterium]|nr:transglutaminase domain-containing protein [Clostridia bacterium]
GFNCAASLYRFPLALTLAVLAAVVSYLFSHKGAGFIPATVLLVLVLFGLWSLGKHNFFWFAAPGLVALLMIISQSSHEKINLFEVLPMAAVVVALAMLITPAGKTVIEPLHKAAMQLKETIADYLFFTEPRNVFTIGSYGYYPMGQGKLGGPAEPSEYPVMMVQTEKKTLLRGVVKDHYTGRNWQDTSSGRRLLYVNPGWRSLRVAAFQENMPDKAVQGASTLLDTKAINIQMQNKAASTLFAPVFLRDVKPQGSLVPYFNEGSELFVTRDLQLDDRYSVMAPVIEGGDQQLGALVNAAASQTDPYYMEIYARYTNLPSHLEETLYYDLQNIIAASATPYDQACAIQRHLQRYYRYTLTPEEPPENQDFVTYFLYVGKEGYCTYYASAMTVLCRMAGLPARYVEGFMAKPAGDGLAYVTGLDAHAWTEVYFEGFGWVPFDPTPSLQEMENQQNEPDEPDPTPTSTPTPEPTPSPTPTHDPNNNDPTPSPTPPHSENTPEPPPMTPEPELPPQDPNDDKPNLNWLWWLLLAAALAALITRMVLRTPDQVAAKQEAVQDQLFTYGNATAQVLRMRGNKVQPGETPMLFARRMDKLK